MNSALFLLAAPALLLQGAHGLRGGENTKSTGERSLQTPTNSFDHKDVQKNSFKESLGKCNGANCGGWGDPHIITCDGLAYDCQGLGIFTLMRNHVFNVQASFVDVGAEEKHITNNELTQGASITNDVMIEYLPESSTPILQFSFGDMKNHDGTYPAEHGCTVGAYYHQTIHGTKKTKEPNVEACRQRCEDFGWKCDKFSYWQSGDCYLHRNWADRYWAGHHWTRVVAGDVDGDCGLRTEDDELLMSEEQNAKASRIGLGCPLLMFVDGEMVDISDVYNNGDLYGQDGDNIHAELIGNTHVRTTYTLDNGDFAVIDLIQAGNGPGELWSCHWDFWVCLPESYQNRFELETVGLLGTPDGNTQNDWMDVDGITIPLDMHGLIDSDWDGELDKDHVKMIDYCYDNWCVGQDNSIMTYHGDATYEDYKCEEEEYIDIVDRDCVLSMDLIEEACRDMPLLMIHACEVDCCYGGCNDIDEKVDEIMHVTTLSNNPNNVLTHIPTFGDCKGDTFFDTSVTTCGSETDVVTLLKTFGSEPLPDGDIFYGITLDMEPTTDVGEITVKFKINNPFPDTADVYIKYEKSVSNDFADPHCAKMKGTPSGCDLETVDIEVLCRDFEGVDPFALVQVYFVSNTISMADSPVIDNCCEPEPYGAGFGTVSYTFEVACGCVPDSLALED